jgi:hypothetical protein
MTLGVLNEDTGLTLTHSIDNSSPWQTGITTQCNRRRPLRHSSC